MNVMQLEWHNRELKIPASVCPHCHSEEMFYEADYEQWQCCDCKLVIYEDTQEQFFNTEHLPQHTCSVCGWHILEHRTQNQFYKWYCPHCYSSFAENEDKTPDKNKVLYAKQCPRCNEKAVLHFKNCGFVCQHCKMRFDSFKNNMIAPNFCRKCEQNSVVSSFLDLNILQCRTCGQKYNKNMDLLDSNNQIINENINETTIEKFSMIVGSQYDNSLTTR